MSDTQPELNLNYLNDIAGGSADFMIEMIDIFLEQTPIYFVQFEEALKVKDWKAVADLAHKIKPTLAFMGVDQAKDDMQAIERNARDQTNVDTIESEYFKLKATCDTLFAQLEQYKKKLEETL